MAKIGIFYGSSTGNTEFVAEKINKFLGLEDVIIQNVDITEKEDVEKCDYLILGTSTWGIGDLQDDWEEFMSILLSIDLSKKKVALFGLGDQEVYAESFVDGMGHLYEKLNGKTNIVGEWPIKDYRFDDSIAVKNNKFVGLALDLDNESGHTDERIKKWTQNLRNEFV